MVMAMQAETKARENPLDEFLVFLVELADLDPRQRDVVMLRTLHMLGRASWSYERIASRLRITTQAAHQIHRRALEQSGTLRRVFAWKNATALRSAGGNTNEQ